MNTETFALPVRDNITLRFIRPDEAETLYRLVDKNREHLEPWLNWLSAQTSPASSLETIQKRLEKANEGSQLDLGIYKDNKLIGSIGFNKISKLNKHAEVGYWISEECQGQGIVTDCVGALINYGFQTLKLHRIEIGCSPHNERSRAIPERLGFTFEGIAREGYLNGERFEDSRKYSMLVGEWTN